MNYVNIYKLNYIEFLLVLFVHKYRDYEVIWISTFTDRYWHAKMHFGILLFCGFAHVHIYKRTYVYFIYTYFFLFRFDVTYSVGIQSLETVKTATETLLTNLRKDMIITGNETMDLDSRIFFPAIFNRNYFLCSGCTL